VTQRAKGDESDLKRHGYHTRLKTRTEIIFIPFCSKS